MSESPGRNPFRFSIAWLMFWTLVCAALAGAVRMFLDLGSTGFDCLLVFTAFVIWLSVTGIAMWWRVYAPRRWAKVEAQRGEMARLVRQRREELSREAEEDADPPRPPGSSGV